MRCGTTPPLNCSLSAGVDLRTVAGRLGHGGGGATTLRVYAAWVSESDRRAAEILLAVGIADGLLAGFGFDVGPGPGTEPGLRFWLVTGLASGLGSGLTVGLAYGFTTSVTWSTTLAWRLQLRRSRQVPNVGLISFLEEARNLDVLRTVGAVYQFRHATLQDQLARQPNCKPRNVLSS